MTASVKRYHLEKSYWTDEDFDQMGWHDNHIYAISFGGNFELLFDIDYIFKWVLTDKTYHFWIAPCTLVFENAYNLQLNISSWDMGVEIDGISRKNPRRPKNADYIERQTEMDWLIDTHQGSISFRSVGYRQYVRQFPRYCSTQVIDQRERGGISFDEIAILPAG
ncbi:hypothetical protein [Niabella sp.]|uniref:hypothetical protein n=1 Tax=Niabella sp. TaxID=1962976 RepID=UPI0026135C0E|nr:hypothetical protein [Niabella sp.]